MKSHKSREKKSGAGFTMIELLVSISIITVLMSLLLPAIGRARESARRTQCLSNMRNVSVAMLSWVGTHERFPAAAYWGPDKHNPQPHHNWVVDILAQLDRQDIADRWNHDASMLAPDNQKLAGIQLPVLTCPSDFTLNGNGDLSFALNGGIGQSTGRNGVQDCIVDPFGRPLDLNGNGIYCVASGLDEGTPSDRDIFRRLGLFFNENWRFSETPGYSGTVRHHRPSTIWDGMSNTLMLTENVRTGYDPYAYGTTWAALSTRRTRVFFSNRICGNNICSTANVDLRRANSRNEGINAGLTRPEGEAPWPSSGHPGGVNAAFADGHAQFISENIDSIVYYAIFTPAGNRLTETPLDEGIVDMRF